MSRLRFLGAGIATSPEYGMAATMLKSRGEVYRPRIGCEPGIAIVPRRDRRATDCVRKIAPTAVPDCKTSRGDFAHPTVRFPSAFRPIFPRSRGPLRAKAPMSVET